MDSIVATLIVLGMLIVTFAWGRYRDLKLISKLDAAEEKLKNIVLLTTQEAPRGWIVTNPQLIYAETVVALDYFQRFVAALRNIFGGSVYTADKVMRMGKRLVLVRLKEKAAQLGANAVLNVRFETSTISRHDGDRQGGQMVELVAYGTAVNLQPADNVHSQGS